jgi:Na+/melibiose symporter-like transporter
MSLSKSQSNYLTGAVVAGALLAILFGVLAANSSGGNQGAYIAACIACVVAGGVALVYLLMRR